MKNEHFHFDVAKIYNMLHQIIQRNQQLEKSLYEIKTRISAPQRGEMLKGILLVEDVSAILGLSTATIYRYIREGILPSSKIGNRYIFYEKDIKFIIDQNYRSFI